jgi:signal peptidase I
MDGKGIGDGVPIEWYPYGPEPDRDQIPDSPPRRRSDPGSVYRGTDSPVPPTAEPDEASASPYQAWGPNDPFVGRARAVRPYVTAPYLTPGTPDDSRNGTQDDPDSRYAGNGNAGGAHVEDSVAPTYRTRSWHEAYPMVDDEGPYQPSEFSSGNGYGRTRAYGQPAYDLAEELAEQRRRDIRHDDDDEPERKPMPLWQELPLLLVVAFCVAVLIRSFLVQAFFIPSSSMEQTLLIGDRVLVNKVLYDVREPERGEVVVFRGTDRWAPENFDEAPGGLFDRIGDTLGDLVGVSRPGEKDFIKRVIGLPGDHVACCDDLGRVTVNGVGIDEPYINANSPLDIPPSPNQCGSRRFAEVVVPAGQLFVMGDNRMVSQDSRCQGPVPIKNVVGRAFMVVWPSDRWGLLHAPDSFDSVPIPGAIGPASGGPAPDPIGVAVVLPLLAPLVGSFRPLRRRRRRPRRLPG